MKTGFYKAAAAARAAANSCWRQQLFDQSWVSQLWWAKEKYQSLNFMKVLLFDISLWLSHQQQLL